MVGKIARKVDPNQDHPPNESDRPARGEPQAAELIEILTEICGSENLFYRRT
jgi:hypothetical protein